MSNKSEDSPNTSFCYLSRPDLGRLFALCDSLYDLGVEHHNATHQATMRWLEIQPTSIDLPERDPMKSGVEYDRAYEDSLAQYRKRSQDALRQRWEMASIDLDYIENMIEKQSKVRSFIEEMDNKRPSTGGKIVMSVFKKSLENQAKDLNAMYYCMKQFAEADLSIGFTTSLNKLQSSTEEIDRLTKIENIHEWMSVNSEKRRPLYSQLDELSEIYKASLEIIHDVVRARANFDSGFLNRGRKK